MRQPSVAMPGDRASILAQNRPARTVIPSPGWRSPVRAGVLSGSPRAGRGPASLQPVAVDEFPGGQLSLGLAERADRGRGVGGEGVGVRADVQSQVRVGVQRRAGCRLVQLAGGPG